MLAPLIALALASTPRMVVLPISPGADVQPQAATAFTNALVGELRRQQPGLEIITQRDVEGLLTVQRSKTLLGCSSDACMAELGGALGADRLITGDVARLGESLMVHLRLFDNLKIRVVAEVDRRFKRGSFDDALDALPAMVTELFRAAPAAPKPAAVAALPAAPPPAPPTPARAELPVVPPGASWRAVVPMPTPRHGAAVVALGDKLYVIGGHRKDRSLATVEVFDPKTGAWQARAPMPSPRDDMAVAVLDGRIYAAGGYDAGLSDRVEEYDPATDTWRKRAPLPGPRTSAAAVAVAGRVLVLGGYTAGPSGYVPEVLAYDPAADRWSRRAAMPVGRARFVAALVGNEVYAIGGDEPRGARVDVYDVAEDRWTTRFRPRAALPQPGWWMAGAVAGERVFVLGGQGGSSAQIQNPGRDDAFVYDVRNNRWTQIPRLPWPRFMFGAAAIGDELYAVGGTAGPKAPSTEWEQFGTVAVLKIAP